MIDIDRLRQLAQGVNEHSDDRAEILAEFYAATQSDTIIELLDRLEAAEKERDWHADRCEDVMDECARLRSKIEAIEAIERQEPTGEWWNCLIADISAVDCMYRGSPTYAHDAYWMRDHVVQILEKRRDSLPGAQNVPKEAIAKILTEVMDIANSNGADSRSMPDEYVEVAAWLCGIPTHPHPAHRKTISV